MLRQCYNAMQLGRASLLDVNSPDVDGQQFLQWLALLVLPQPGFLVLCSCSDIQKFIKSIQNLRNYAIQKFRNSCCRNPGFLVLAT